MNFLLVQVFFISFELSFAAENIPCSKNICSACSFIKSRNSYCLALQSAKCCDAWKSKTHHSLVPSSSESDNVAAKMIPEIFREKEATSFTPKIIYIICFGLIFLVVFIIQLERIIKEAVSKQRKKKEFMDEEQIFFEPIHTVEYLL